MRAPAVRAAGAGAGVACGSRTRVSTWMSGAVAALWATGADETLAVLRALREGAVDFVEDTATSLAGSWFGRGGAVTSKASGERSAARRLGAGGKGMVAGPRSVKEKRAQKAKSRLEAKAALGDVANVA